MLVERDEDAFRDASRAKRGNNMCCSVSSSESKGMTVF